MEVQFFQSEDSGKLSSEDANEDKRLCFFGVGLISVEESVVTRDAVVTNGLYGMKAYVISGGLLC